MLWGLRPPGEDGEIRVYAPESRAKEVVRVGVSRARVRIFIQCVATKAAMPTCKKFCDGNGPGAPRTPLRRSLAPSAVAGAGAGPRAPGRPLSSGTGTRPLALRCAPARPTYGFMCAVFSCPTPPTPRPVPPYAEALARPKVIVNVVALIVNDVALIVNDTGASWRSRVPNAGRAGPWFYADKLSAKKVTDVLQILPFSKRHPSCVRASGGTPRFAHAPD